MDHGGPVLGPLALDVAGGTDIDSVLQLLCEARLWQEQAGVDVWHPIDRDRIAGDVAARRVLIARDEGVECGTVTVQETDGLIWGADDAVALYVHRLVVSRRAKGRGVGFRILAGLRDLARQRGKTCLRLDTWDRNEKIRHYYERQGFRHVRDTFFAPARQLPPDYSGTWKSLYELDLAGT